MYDYWWGIPWIPDYHIPFNHVLVADFQAAVLATQKSLTRDASSTIVPGRLLRHIRKLLTGPILYYYRYETHLSLPPGHALLGQQNYLPSLRVLLCHDELKSMIDSEAPGLRRKAFNLSADITHVAVDENGVLGMAFQSLTLTIFAN